MNNSPRKTLRVNPEKRSRNRKIVGHEAWLEDRLKNDPHIYVYSELFANQVGRCKLIGHDKYSITVIFNDGELVIFKSCIRAMAVDVKGSEE